MELKVECLNSLSGRKDGKEKQPSFQDRIYSTNGLSIAINTFSSPIILEQKNGIRNRKMVLGTE
ncbi:MAG: hypothetical protein MJ181_11525, partial [Treponema sp.]|nr:hypothetical protein [Treponema sp.]